MPMFYYSRTYAPSNDVRYHEREFADRAEFLAALERWNAQAMGLFIFREEPYNPKLPWVGY